MLLGDVEAETRFHACCYTIELRQETRTSEEGATGSYTRHPREEGRRRGLGLKDAQRD